MEGDSEEPQFDSYLGGSQTVPSGLQLSDFIKQRMEEVVMLTEAIEESPFRGQAFQRLPKHMRRRQMSHYIKRLPRRLQRPYLMSLKDGPPAPNKRPSRKYRRRPGNLLLEYNRRQKSSIWLETHIWHAKRFHMTTKWGYRLAEKPVNKSFRACYRALSEHCLLVDVSYYNCIELSGTESELLEGLRRCTSADCGPTFAARAYLPGTREGTVTLFHPDRYPYGVIGSVTFMWRPVTSGDRYRKIWIWVHPRLHDEAVECFKKLFELCHVPASPVEEDVIVEKVRVKAKVKKNSKRNQTEELKLEPKNVPFDRTPKYKNKSETVGMTLLKDTLNRFRLTGPLAQAVVAEAFTVAAVGSGDTSGGDVVAEEVESKRRRLEAEEEVQETERKMCWWEQYYREDGRVTEWLSQKKFPLGEYSRPSDMPSGMVLGLVVEDPRMRIPRKREKAVFRKTEIRQMPESSLDPRLSQSPLWVPEIRDEVSLRKLTTEEINEGRSHRIVPGFDVGSVIRDHLHSRIPILLVQRPGSRNTQNGTLGLGSGWDIISPAGFGMPIWLSLVFRGARTGGLSETDLLHLESGNLPGHLPPDSTGGETENRENLRTLTALHFGLPPNKRPNYTRLGVVSPFYPPWKQLIRDWTGRTDPTKEQPTPEQINFHVLRDLKALKELQIAKRAPTTDTRQCLVPVVVEYTGRGKPTDLSLICLPADEDFRASREPVEPSHSDPNEKHRKVLKSEHSKHLKSLRRRRKKDSRKAKEELANNLAGDSKRVPKTVSGPPEAPINEYREKMERLWLTPVEEIETVAETSSRAILGLVTRGGFSYSKSRGLGLGHVTLPGLAELFRVCERNSSRVVVLVRNGTEVQYKWAKLRIGVE